MVTRTGKYGIVKEILYFERPDRLNTDDMLGFIVPKIEKMDLKHVMIAWSSGYTLYKFLKATRDIKVKLNITAVTNPKGGTMGGRSVSIDDETREKLGKQCIKVCYLNDDLRLGEPMAPTPEQKHMREQLLPWMPFHIDPLSLDVGTDLSMFFTISQGYRVCVGCLALAVKHGLIPEGERVLCLAGMATACILEASAFPRKCYLKEILSYELNSDWSQQDQEALKRMVAITKQ